MDIDVTMFQQAFFDEAAELLSDLENCLLKLEDNPADRELLNTIFRCAHSLKGGSATFGLPDIAKFTHGLETLLDRMRDGLVQTTPEICTILFQSLDQLRSLLAAATGVIPSAPDSQALSARIEAAAAGSLPAVEAEPAPAEEEGFGFWGIPKPYLLRIVPATDVLKTGCDPLLLIETLSELAEITKLTCDTSALPTLAELDPDTSYLGWEIELITDQEPARILEHFEFLSDDSEITLNELTPTPAAPAVGGPSVAAQEPAKPKAAPAEAPVAASATPVKAESQTLRVPSEKVDKLVNLVGELVINQSMLSEVTQNFTMDDLPKLLEAVGMMERASRELQERVMGIRLVPLKHAFARFPRLVRDLSAACHKKIELVTSGEDTELDKTLIEAIGDPLTHLVRNSIDHGLETPEERRAAGKPESGTVALHSYYDSGSVVIEVSDDGKGLNRERILAKARENGLVGDDADSMSDDAVYALIFQPGFSTAAAVTDLSGRGVGMDIVRQSVQALNGSISLSTEPGRGTKFRIRLPLTMAIMEGLILQIGREAYILPLTSIVESIRPERADLTTLIGRDEVVRVRGDVLPMLRLHRVFGSSEFQPDPCQAILVIVESEGHKVALLVDELIGQNQAVIKSLEANYRKVEGIAGATILGDGRVALILDVPCLVRSGSALAAANAA